MLFKKKYIKDNHKYIRKIGIYGRVCKDCTKEYSFETCSDQYCLVVTKIFKELYYSGFVAGQKILCYFPE